MSEQNIQRIADLIADRVIESYPSALLTWGGVIIIPALALLISIIFTMINNENQKKFFKKAHENSVFILNYQHKRELYENFVKSCGKLMGSRNDNAKKLYEEVMECYLVLKLYLPDENSRKLFKKFCNIVKGFRDKKVANDEIPKKYIEIMNKTFKEICEFIWIELEIPLNAEINESDENAESTTK